MGRDRGSPMNRSRLAQKYPPGLVNAILIAIYATSIGIAHNLLYKVEGSKMLQSDVSFENNMVIDGLVKQPEDIYRLSNNQTMEVYPLEESPEPKENFPGTHPLSLEALSETCS